MSHFDPLGSDGEVPQGDCKVTLVSYFDAHGHSGPSEVSGVLELPTLDVVRQGKSDL